MDLSQLTDAELTTLKTNLLGVLNGSALGGESYTIGTRTMKRPNITEAAKILSAVNTEIRLRGDAGGGLILVDFDDPS